MPRLARLDAPGVLHHVMKRGIEGNEIIEEYPAAPQTGFTPEAHKSASLQQAAGNALAVSVQNDTDRRDFMDRLNALAINGALDVYSWTLMPNHFHLLVKTRSQPLSANMRKLLTGYVVNYNKRHRRYGHLFLSED